MLLLLIRLLGFPLPCLFVLPAQTWGWDPGSNACMALTGHFPLIPIRPFE